MGALSSSIGALFGGAQNNADFTATGANIAQPTTVDQAQQAYQTAQGGLTQQQQLLNALQGQNGIQNQSNVFNQLQGVANGTGPNPALAQLNQTTGQNVANQAALMAGQRGAGANVGLEARQAAQQGASTQQQAAGQAATLESQQQLNALNQLGGLAGQQVAQQTGAVSGLNAAAQGEQGQLLGGINAQNTANIQNQGNLNATNASIANSNAGNTAKTLGGIFQGIAGAASSLAGGGTGAYKGGKIENPKLKTIPQQDRFSNNLIPSHMKQMAEFYHGDNFKMGGKVPGKAEVKGDSPTNDTVPAMLSPGEFVIPKSVMESKDPISGAAKMIAAHQKKHGDTKKLQGDFKSALQRAIQNRKSSYAT